MQQNPNYLRDGPFDIQGGWDFFEKNSLFPYRREKNKNKNKNKKFVVHSANFFEALLPQSYKGLQITQNLTCTKHVDLLLAK